MNSDDMATFKLYGLAVILLIVAVLMYVGRDYLPLIAFWSGVLAMIILAILLVYFGHKLYCKFRQNHLEMVAKALVVRSQDEEIKSQQQARRLADARWQAEYNALLFGQSMQASRVYADQRGNMPILVRPLEDGGYQYQQLPPPAYYGQQLALPAPALTKSDPVTDEMEELQLNPQKQQVKTFRQLLLDGTIQRALAEQKLIVGYEKVNGILRIGTWTQFYSCGIGGVSGTGKSTTVRFLLFQAILDNSRFVFIDPHIGDIEESLAAQFRMFPHIHQFEPCDGNPQRIIKRIRWLAKELARRKQAGIKGPRLVLVIDEFNEVMRATKEIRDEITEFLLNLEQGGRKFGMFGMLIGQRWSSQDLGGADIRTSLASMLAHRFTDEDQAKKMVGSK